MVDSISFLHLGTDTMNKLLIFRGFASLMLLAVLAQVFLASQSLQAASMIPSSAAETISIADTPGAGLLLASDDGWSIRNLFRGLNTRARVIQICVVTMCLALLILMKK